MLVIPIFLPMIPFIVVRFVPIVVEETFAIMIAELCSVLVILRGAGWHTTMSNFNLRLLPTFSFDRPTPATGFQTVEVPVVN